MWLAKVHLNIASDLDWSCYLQSVAIYAITKTRQREHTWSSSKQKNALLEVQCLRSTNKLSPVRSIRMAGRQETLRKVSRSGIREHSFVATCQMAVAWNCIKDRDTNVSHDMI